MRAETKNAGGVEYSLISYEFCQGFKVEQRIILGIPALDIKSTSIDDGELKMFREREKEFQDTVEGRFKNEFEHKSLTEALRGYGRSGIIIIGNLFKHLPTDLELKRIKPASRSCLSIENASPIKRLHCASVRSAAEAETAERKARAKRTVRMIPPWVDCVDVR